MKQMKLVKYLTMALMAIGCVLFTSCSSDNNDVNNGSSNTEGNPELFINGKSYGSIPYAYFLDEGVDGNEHTGSFIFSNLRMSSGDFGTAGTKWTYLSVRVPVGSDGEIPVGSFTGKRADADFDVNRILPDGSCDLTGWSLSTNFTVSKSGNKYIINIDNNEFSIFYGDDEYGKGTKGLVSFKYEGEVEKLSY